MTFIDTGWPHVCVSRLKVGTLCKVHYYTILFTYIYTNNLYTNYHSTCYNLLWKMIYFLNTKLSFRSWRTAKTIISVSIQQILYYTIPYIIHLFRFERYILSTYMSPYSVLCVWNKSLMLYLSKWSNIRTMWRKTVYMQHH